MPPSILILPYDRSPMHLLLMVSPHRPSERHIRTLGGLPGVTDVAVADDEAAARRSAADADVIVGHRYLRQSLPYAKTLEWVQSTTQGVDRLPTRKLAEKGVRLTRYTGSAATVARHAVSLAWSVVRRIPTAVRQQRRAEWRKEMDWLPTPESAIVFGTGSIGRSIGELLQAHGLSVTGVKRSVDGPLPSFDRLLGSDEWRGALTDRDLCILALPRTSETEGLLDDDALDALPSHAVVVNVGRGETLCLGPLVERLREESLGGAALDALSEAREPLSAASPLWDVPRLTLTPHVAAYHPNRQHRVERFCEAQVRRYLDGEPLVDEVDLSTVPPTASTSSPHPEA